MSSPNQWADLYKTPNPNTIFNLGAQGFRDFVRYVFERGGFQVDHFQGHGADFELRNENRTIGYIATAVGVGHVNPTPILALNGLPGQHNAIRYFISSAGFTQESRDTFNNQNRDTRNLHLIDIDRLTRYINYVRGTRHPKSKGPPISPAHIFENEQPKRPLSRTKVMVLANNKGGVCKTTSSLAIALILAGDKNKRVLLVDVDDQANLTQAAFGEIKHDLLNISDHFADSTPLSQLIQPTRFNNVWIIPSHPDLRLTLSLAVDWSETEQQFVHDIHHDSIKVPGSGDDFDWIIIDTPPALSLYTRAALLAAHFVVTPFTPSLLDQTGLENLLETLDEVKCLASAANQTRMLGCFATRYKRTTASTQDFTRLKALTNQNGAPLFATDIGEDATNTRKLFLPDTVVNITRTHGALDDYRQLVEEIRNHVGDN